MALKCENCNFATQCVTNHIDGIGKKSSKIMLVLDSPDWIDDKNGRPLEGDGGAKVDYYLRRAKINRKDVYVTYAVKCKPKGKASEKIKKKHLDACRINLLSEIKKVKPEVMVLMGRYAHEILSGQTSVKEFRGHFEDFEMSYTVTVGENKKKKKLKSVWIPTYSPYSALSKWEYDDYIIHDLKKARKYTETGKVPKTPIPKYNTILTLDQLEDFVKTYTTTKLFTHDFETTALEFHKGEIINSGYCHKKDHADILYLLRDWPKEHQKKFEDEDKKRVEQIMEFTNTNWKIINEAAKEVHASKAKKAGHNHKFDQKWAMRFGHPFKNFAFDTVILDAVLDENKAHDLNSAMEYQGINYGPYDTELWKYVNKDRKKKKPYTYVPPNLLEKYLAIDVCGDFRLLHKVWPKVKKQGFKKFYLDQQLPLVNELAKMEYKGFKMRVKKMEKDAVKLEKRIDKITTKLRKVAKDETFNPNSPAQLSALMEGHDYPFERLEIRRGANGYSTGVDALEKFMRYKKWRKIPEMVLKLRGMNKLKSTYIINKDGDKGMLPKVDDKGYLHCSFNVHTPRTGRLSSQDPNFQNIPNPTEDELIKDINIRNYFIPPYKDWCTWEADYSALEMNVVAHLSGDKVMIKQLQQGIDMHSYNAVRFGHALGYLSKKVDYKEFMKRLKYEPPEGWEKLKSKSKEKTEVRTKLKLKKEAKGHRGFSKAVGFGLNYGIEARTLAEDHNKDVDDVIVAIDTYFDGYKGMYKWRQKQCELAVERGYLKLPWTGRKRRFTSFSKWINSPEAENIRRREFFISEIERQAMNFPVQGFANEIFTRGKLRVIKRLRKEGLKSTIRITIHDGVVGVGPISEMQRVKKICEEEMTTILGEGKKKLVLGIDFNANKYWYGPEIKVA